VNVFLSCANIRLLLADKSRRGPICRFLSVRILARAGAAIDEILIPVPGEFGEIALGLSLDQRSLRLAELLLGLGDGRAALRDLLIEFRGFDFGHELDLAVSYPFLKSLVGKIEFADYRAGDPISAKVDTRKIWFTLIYNY